MYIVYKWICVSKSPAYVLQLSVSVWNETRVEQHTTFQLWFSHQIRQESPARYGVYNSDSCLELASLYTRNWKAWCSNNNVSLKQPMCLKTPKRGRTNSCLSQRQHVNEHKTRLCVDGQCGLLLASQRWEPCNTTFDADTGAIEGLSMTSELFEAWAFTVIDYVWKNKNGLNLDKWCVKKGIRSLSCAIAAGASL